VASAEQALLRLRGAPTGDPACDLVIVDQEMPGTNGLDLVRRLRADRSCRYIPVVLLTTIAAADPETFQDLGIRGYVTKPLRRSALLEEVERACGLRRALPSSMAGPSDRMVWRRPAGPRVLVVEDNATNQEVMVALLEYLGFRPEIASNGREALEKLEHDQGFGAVLMDCQMPGVDGYSATAALREIERREGRRRLPVIAVTAHALKDDRERALAAGMDDYVSKPVRPPVIEALLHKWARTAATPEGEPLPASQPELAAEEPGAPPRLDQAILAGLRRLAERRPGFLQRVFGTYLTEAEAHLAELAAAARDGDTERLRHTAHTLKGSSRNVGAMRLAAIFERLQDLSGDGAEALLAEARAEFAVVRPELETLATPPAPRAK
jgi:CheY-like chemotaxis protein